MFDRILRLNRVVFHPCVYQQPFFKNGMNFITKLKIYHLSCFYVQTLHIDIADPSSMQDVYHINFVQSLWLSGRASECEIRGSEVRFLMGTQNFFFVPRSWQDRKHLSLEKKKRFCFRNPGNSKSVKTNSNILTSIWILYSRVFYFIVCLIPFVNKEARCCRKKRFCLRNLLTLKSVKNNANILTSTLYSRMFHFTVCLTSFVNREARRCSHDQNQLSFRRILRSSLFTFVPFTLLIQFFMKILKETVEGLIIMPTISCMCSHAVHRKSVLRLYSNYGSLCISYHAKVRGCSWYIGWVRYSQWPRLDLFAVCLFFCFWRSLFREQISSKKERGLDGSNWKNYPT